MAFNAADKLMKFTNLICSNYSAETTNKIISTKYHKCITIDSSDRLLKQKHSLLS